MVLASAGAFAVPGLVLAQRPLYPRLGATIRYVVPFPPGGLTDVVAPHGGTATRRAEGKRRRRQKAGRRGMIGADVVAKAPPDGYMILAITTAHAVNVTLFRGHSPCDLERYLKPVALLAGSPMLVVVPDKSPIHSLQDLVATAKAKPHNAGSSGVGTPSHLTLALFNQLNGTQIQYVPYKGGAPSITDLIGRQLAVIFSNFPESMAQVKAGELRALAIASAQRHPQLPDVPTTAEAGMPQLKVENWTAVMAPGGTPDAIVQPLSDAIVRIMNTPDMAEKAKSQNFRVDAWRRPSSRSSCTTRSRTGKV
jgi:tripartite-type tricarboxylate transporter receptor subunit TctC